MTDTKVCERCGQDFTGKPNCKPSDWRVQRFCSKSCIRSKGKRNAEPYRVDPAEVLKSAYAVARRKGTPNSFLDDVAQELAMAGMNSLWYYSEGYWEKGVFAYLKFCMNREYNKAVLRANTAADAQALDDEETDFDVTLTLVDYREPNPADAAEANDSIRVMLGLVDSWPEEARSLFRRMHIDGYSMAKISKEVRARHHRLSSMLSFRFESLRQEMRRRTA